MANIYYKNNGTFQQITYADVGAAAANHTHNTTLTEVFNNENGGETGEWIAGWSGDDEESYLMNYPFSLASQEGRRDFCSWFSNINSVKYVKGIKAIIVFVTEESHER